MKIAIIGAGLAGLTLARHLDDIADLTVFEKSRGVGGRMSTRSAAPYQFDHGAQYFTARDRRFQEFLQEFTHRGCVTPWSPRMVILEKGKTPEPHALKDRYYVATPKMTSLAHVLADPLNLQLSTRVESIEKAASAWRLRNDKGEDLGTFDWLICSAPAAQSAKLMPREFSHHALLQGSQMRACFSLMLGFTKTLPLHWDVARVKASAIRWIAANNSKPQRDGDYSLVVQTTNVWAQEYIDAHADDIEDLLLQELSELLQYDVTRAAHRDMHRWRYADTADPAGRDFLIDDERHLAACGDWCTESRVENAFLSGLLLAGALRERLV